MRTLDTVFLFTGGMIQALEDPPEWLKDAHIAYRECDDFDQALSDQGAEMIESYGVVNESLDVWRHEGGGWLVDWQDTNSVIMSIYIANATDFATFQTAWLCNMATKIMAADVYIRANAERQAADEKAEASVH
jgi:hypothetical protein